MRRRDHAFGEYTLFSKLFGFGDNFLRGFARNQLVKSFKLFRSDVWWHRGGVVVRIDRVFFHSAFRDDDILHPFRFIHLSLLFFVHHRPRKCTMMMMMIRGRRPRRRPHHHRVHHRNRSSSTRTHHHHPVLLLLLLFSSSLCCLCVDLLRVVFLENE